MTVSDLAACHDVPLVWMLRTGIAVDEAYVLVQALVGGEDTAKTVRSSASASSAPDEPQVRASANPPSAQLDNVPVRPQTAASDRDRFAEAVRLNRQHWVATGRPISAETLRQQLHVSADTSRELTRAIRAADRAAVITAGVRA